MGIKLAVSRHPAKNSQHAAGKVQSPYYSVFILARIGLAGTVPLNWWHEERVFMVSTLCHSIHFVVPSDNTFAATPLIRP